MTEELWGHLRSALRESPISDLRKDWPEALIVATWPEPGEPEGWEQEKIADFTLIQEVVRSIRNLRAEMNVSPSKRLEATIVSQKKSCIIKRTIIRSLRLLQARPGSNF